MEIIVCGKRRRGRFQLIDIITYMERKRLDEDRVKWTFRCTHGTVKGRELGGSSSPPSTYLGLNVCESCMCLTHRGTNVFSSLLLITIKRLSCHCGYEITHIRLSNTFIQLYIKQIVSTYNLKFLTICDF